jgi:hypothetical protein
MDDAKKDLYWVIGIFIALAFLWYFMGGEQRGSFKTGLFLNQPQQKYTHQLEEDTKEVLSGEITTPTPTSQYKKMVLITSTSGSTQTDPKKEYIEITAASDNKSPIRITGWKLVGERGLDISIGQGAILAYSGQVNSQNDIFLNPGESAYIITGQSPIGTSFKLNKCSGYFSQFNVFIPSLPRQCSDPSKENLPTGLEDACLDYIDDLPRCRMQISIPSYLSPQCQAYINDKVNYTTCVDVHKNDLDFYKPEWRIYLGRTDDLWKKDRELIILKDESGNIVDSDSY